jgi:N utilization substance protein B
MINRILIRLKVLQVVYAYYQKNSRNLESAESELLRSLQKSYDLYNYFLQLVLVVTDAEQKRLDSLKYKYLPSENELNPDLRFINNRFAEQLRTNKTLTSFTNKNGFLWQEEDAGFIRDLLKEISSSEIYANYMENPDSYENDKEIWGQIFKKIILENKDLPDIMEEKSIYWDSDWEIVGTFVTKTIKRFQEENGTQQELLPMYKSEADKQFAIMLLHKTILEYDENRTLIEHQTKNWDLDRVALIDLYIMQIALSEIKNFPTIPINVSLNEYIDLAHYYSTPKSSHFINGILDSVVKELKSDEKLFKN